MKRIEFLGNDTLIYCQSDLTQDIITSKIISDNNLKMKSGNKYKFYVENQNIFKYSKDTESLSK